MKIRTIALILFLALIILLVLLLKFFSGKPTEQNPQVKPTPEAKSEVLIKISLTNINSEQMDITTPIRLQANAVAPQKLVFSISPEIAVESDWDNSTKEFVISPTDAWAFNTEYTIRMEAGKNKGLDKDYSFSFKTAPYAGI